MQNSSFVALLPFLFMSLQKMSFVTKRSRQVGLVCCSFSFRGKQFFCKVGIFWHSNAKTPFLICSSSVRFCLKLNNCRIKRPHKINFTLERSGIVSLKKGLYKNNSFWQGVGRSPFYSNQISFSTFLKIQMKFGAHPSTSHSHRATQTYLMHKWHNNFPIGPTVVTVNNAVGTSNIIQSDTFNKVGSFFLPCVTGTNHTASFKRVGHWFKTENWVIDTFFKFFILRIKKGPKS